MTNDGFVKLCDFGISKIVVGRTYTLCGTPEYMSPEMIQQKGHNQAVDWWMLGVFIYEMMTGQTPFADSSAWNIYKAVNRGIEKIMWPPIITDSGNKATLVELCQSNPSRRMPMLSGGLMRLRNKRLFGRIECSKLATPGWKVPFKPPRMEAIGLKGRVLDRDIHALHTQYVAEGLEEWDAHF